MPLNSPRPEQGVITAWGQWLPPGLVSGPTPERPRRGYSKGPSATLFAGGLLKLKSITVRPSWLWLLPGAAGVCSTVMAGAAPSTRLDGVAVPGMASRGDPMCTPPIATCWDGGVCIGDRGKGQLNLGMKCTCGSQTPWLNYPLPCAWELGGAPLSCTGARPDKPTKKK